MSTPTEVIDLTSPPISVVDLPSDGEPDVLVIESPSTATTTPRPIPTPNGPNVPNGRHNQDGKKGGETRAKKKRTKKRKSTNSTPAQSAHASRATSEEGVNEPAASTSSNANNTANAKNNANANTNTNNANSGGGGRAKRKRNNIAGEDEHPARRARKDDGDAVASDPPADADAGAEPEDAKDLFFVDLAPAPVPAARLPLQVVDVGAGVPNGVANVNADANGDVVGDAPKLLVPAHVTVLGSTPVEIIQPLSDGEVDEDFIDYLDFDDTKHITRYYDEAPDEAAAISRTVCKNCGAEGDHKTSACTVMICLTCGARNEHSTRSCPISKVCFTCGMKGHINANCPNRRTARAMQSSREVECERCGSSKHKTNECPTVWRLYEYYSVQDQVKTIELRHSKQDLPLGKGGEGYVADDDWCYNCGDSGHLGDDCPDLDTRGFPRESSAFCLLNIMTGPFYDPENRSKAPTSRSRVRDWEANEDVRWGKDLPGNVGRQGRMKSRAALEKQAQQQDDDADDWFGNNASRSRTSKEPPRGPRNATKPMFTFGKTSAPSRKYDDPLGSGAPSLLQRMGEPTSNYDRTRDRDRDRDRDSRRSHGSSHKRDRDRGDESYGGSKDSRRRRDDRHPNSSGRGYDRRRDDTGPRYRGGYIAR